MLVDEKGWVTHVDNGGQAERKGIQVGMRIVELAHEGEPYSDEKFYDLTHSDQIYVVGFQAIDDVVENMKNDILNGDLRVYVYNKSLVKETKRLAVNLNNRRVSLLRDDGLCDAAWGVDNLKCIMQ